MRYMDYMRSCMALALALGAVLHGAAFAQTVQVPDLSDPKMIASGEKRFNQNCVYCHGNAGSGGKAAALQGRNDLAADYVFETISNGKKRGSFQMPAWKGAFSEAQIWELDAYIMSLRQLGGGK